MENQVRCRIICITIKEKQEKQEKQTNVVTAAAPPKPAKPPTSDAIHLAAQEPRQWCGFCPPLPTTVKKLFAARKTQLNSIYSVASLEPPLRRRIARPPDADWMTLSLTYGIPEYPSIRSSYHSSVTSRTSDYLSDGNQNIHPKLELFV